MPLEIHEATSPRGLRYLVVDVEGRVELADAQRFGDWVLPGKPYHRGHVLTRAAKGTDYSPEARKYFSNLGNESAAVAVVVTSPIVRAAINLMLRFANQRGGDLRMFSDEGEALAWLESRALNR